MRTMNEMDITPLTENDLAEHLRQQLAFSPIWQGLPGDVKADRLRTLQSAMLMATPASSEQIVHCLTPCLAQVAIGSMTTEDRHEWLLAAAMTMTDMALPSDVMIGASRAARMSARCDHPSKIVPEIVKAAGDIVEQRRTDVCRAELALCQPMPIARVQPRIEPEKEWTQAEVDDANDLFRRLRLATRYTFDPDAPNSVKSSLASEKDGHPA